MSKISYDGETLKLMSLFENLTKSKLKDCFVDNLEKLTFVVEEGEIRKALGKDLSNLRKLEGMLKRKIRIIEFSDELLKFISNLMYPNKIKDIMQEGKVITVVGEDTRSKGLMIGAQARNLRNSEFIAKKYFEVDEIKVV